NPTLGAAKKYFKNQISVLRAEQKLHKRESDEYLKIETKIKLMERMRDEVISKMKTDKKFVWTMHNYRVYLTNEALHPSEKSINDEEYNKVESSTFAGEMDEEARSLRFSSGTITSEDLDKKCRSAFADTEFKETETVTPELKTVRELLSAKTASELVDYSNTNSDADVDNAICTIIKDQNKLDGLSLTDLATLFASYKFKDGQDYLWSVLSPKIDALSIEEVLKIREQQIFEQPENADRTKLLEDAIIKILSGYSALALHKYMAAHADSKVIERLSKGALGDKLNKELGEKGMLLFVTEAKRKADEKVDGEGYAALQQYMMNFVMELESTPGFYYTTEGEFLFHKPAPPEETSKPGYDPLSESVLLWQVDKKDASKGKFELLRFPYSDNGEEKKPVTQYELLRTAAFGYNENTTYATAQKLTISVAFNRDIKKKDKTLLDAWDDFGPGTPHSYMMSKYNNYADLYNAAKNEALEVPGKSNQVTDKIRTGIKSSIESFQSGPSSVAIFEHGRDLLSEETTVSPYDYTNLSVSIDYYSKDNIKKRQEAWDKEKAKDVEELDKALNKLYPNAKDSKTKDDVRKTKMAEIDKKYVDKKIADNVYWKWPAHWINYLAEGFRYADAGDISKGWYKPENFIKGQDFHPDENGNKAKYEKKGEETNGYRLVCVGTAGGNLFLINDPDVPYPNISKYTPQNWSVKSKPKGT
ncbi:MAG TPA: hypothetical protein VK666_06580, partial [Chryseolinea sp.]|nr:hypothetical protein [Chryseolinea sp.]